MKHNVRQHRVLLSVHVKQDPCREDGLHNVNLTHALSRSHTDKHAAASPQVRCYRLVHHGFRQNNEMNHFFKGLEFWPGTAQSPDAQHQPVVR